jgi:hypothetical protein
MSKGSGRRPERNGSYRDNFDRIFNKPEPLHNAHVILYYELLCRRAEKYHWQMAQAEFYKFWQWELGDEE